MERLSSDGGMLPVNPMLDTLPLMSRCISLERCPSDGETVPVSLLDDNTTLVTLCGVPLTVTPSHVVIALL